MTPSGSSASPDDNAFNHLTQHSQADSQACNQTHPPANDSQPRAKRIACVLCRKRKLRCDGARPKCSTCSRLSHECGYEELRKKSGPKRGYVKLLEARLQQVETLLQKDGSEQNSTAERQTDYTVNAADVFDHDYTTTRSTPYASAAINPSLQRTTLPNPTAQASSRTDIIGLGLEEPLPPPEAVTELHEIYFRLLHPSMPMIHRPRYLAALHLTPSMCPPPCLRYIIWALAASVSDKYGAFADVFYQRARRYADLDEMKGHGEALITLAHCQTWILISWYEFKSMYFPRAWQDTGRATSLALMMGLNRVDGAGLDVKQCLPPAKDWTEREERRRTFWMAFCADRYASIGTGWPLRLDEQDIMTLLPSSDDAFVKSQPETTPSLEQAFSLSGSANVSSIASVILIACLLGRNLTHLHRPTAHDNEEDLNGEFWQRHRRLESLLANICLALPDHLRIPNGLPDPNVIFMNMLLHTSVICLHQAAIFKADRKQLPLSLLEESRARCVSGASEIARIMKMISHIDMAPLNPFIAFCLYVAARVFVQYLKWRPKDPNMIASLHFLGSAMHVMKKKNPLTESFLAQLEVDLDGTGIVIGPKVVSPWGRAGDSSPLDAHSTRRAMMAEVPLNTDSVKCSPLFEIRSSQTTQAVDDAVFRPRNTSTSTRDGPEPAVVNNDLVNEDAFAEFSKHASHFISQIPTRLKGNSPYNSGTTFDTDLSTTPSTTDMDYAVHDRSQSNSSYRDNSSHTSFTPPSGPTDDINTQGQDLLPNVKNSNDPLMHDGMFLGVTDSNFANFLGSQLFGSTPYTNSAEQPKMPQGWDFGSAEMGTGLTPMSEHQWNDLGQTSTWGGTQSNGEFPQDNRRP